MFPEAPSGDSSLIFSYAAKGGLMAPLIPRGGDDATPLYLLGHTMPWHVLRDWAPFSFDAVGLITLLGSEEVNKSIGSLQRRRYSEFFPLLAGFVIAGDYFTDGESGYALFNITAGIYTTEIKPWFTRWLSLQDVNKETTVFTFETKKRDSKFDLVGDLIAPLISYAVVATFLACTIVMGDWPGVANFVAILASMGVRNILLTQRRAATNSMATESNAKMSTMFVTRADGRMVTIYAPLSVVKTICIENCEPPSPLLYHSARAIGWLFFGGHIIILGMSSLFTQLITVALMVLPTWFLCANLDFDIGRVKQSNQQKDGVERCVFKQRSFASDLLVTQENPVLGGGFSDRRMHAYAYVRPSKEQEMMLQHWCLLPIQGLPWLQDYRITAKKQAYEKAARACQAAKADNKPIEDLERQLQHWTSELEDCNRKLDQWSNDVSESDSWYDSYGIAKAELARASNQATPVNGAVAAAPVPNGATAPTAKSALAASTAVPSPSGTSRIPSSSAQSGASQPSSTPADGIVEEAEAQHNKQE